MRQTIERLLKCLLGVVLFSGVSCIRDAYPEAEGVSGGGSSPVTVELRLRTSDGLFGGAQSATRSAVYDRERRVGNALVLFFHGTDDAATLYAVSEGENLPGGTTGGTVTFQASLVVEPRYAEDPFTCVVLANMEGRTLTGDLNGGGTTLNVGALQAVIGRTYGELQAVLNETVGGALLTGGGDLFPMCGRASESLIPSRAAAQRLSVSLIRSVARVQLYNAAVADFALTEAYVFRATDRMALLPLSGAFGGSSSDVVTKPSIPSGAGSFSSAAAWKYEVSDNRSEGEIYLPEADTHLTGSGAVPGDANHANRCAVVVGGSYGSGAVNYYRIDFTTTSGDTRELLDVLRNHSYNITVSAVRGPGETTPEEAYESPTTNIDASVIEWTDENQEMVFDGTNWMSVNRKRIEFADGSGLEALVSAKSNLPPSTWQMAFGDGVLSSEATVRGTYFSVTKPADGAAGAAEQGGNLVIRTLQRNPSVAEGGAVREELLHIRAGRLDLEVTLVQNPYEDTPWEDGGSIDGDLMQ